MNITILRFETIGSTNDEALRQARLGADEGLCIMARQQTSGRGRHGRVWASDLDSGLYLSIVLRPNIETRFFPLITLMSGVSVHDTLKEVGLSPDIKWVNDILVGDKKISGILAETTETSKGVAVIVGIGINLTLRNLPDDIRETATSIEAETGRRTSAEELAEVLTKYLAYFYRLLGDKTGPQEIIEHWRQRSSYFSGRAVRVKLTGKVLEGTTDGLEENGALRVRTTTGELRVVQAGDVERLRPRQNRER